MVRLEYSLTFTVKDTSNEDYNFWYPNAGDAVSVTYGDASRRSRCFLKKFAKPLLIEEVEAIFEREGIAPRFRPLAPSTVAEKRRLGLDRGILRRTGKLFRAYTNRFRCKGK